MATSVRGGRLLLALGVLLTALGLVAGGLPGTSPAHADPVPPGCGTGKRMIEELPPDLRSYGSLVYADKCKAQAIAAALENQVSATDLCVVAAPLAGLVIGTAAGGSPGALIGTGSGAVIAGGCGALKYFIQMTINALKAKTAECGDLGIRYNLTRPLADINGAPRIIVRNFQCQAPPGEKEGPKDQVGTKVVHADLVQGWSPSFTGTGANRDDTAGARADVDRKVAQFRAEKSAECEEYGSEQGVGNDYGGPKAYYVTKLNCWAV